MTEQLAEVVGRVCAADLRRLEVAELQALTTELRQAAGQLQGRLDQVLAELDERSGGQVRENPGSEQAPLFMATQTWWREEATLSGGQAGRDLRRVGVLRRLPGIARSVTAGRLSPAQAAVLCRLDGKIPAADLAACQEQLVLVAAPMNPEALAQWVRHQIATHCEPALDSGHDAAYRKRYLQLTRNPNGTVSGRFVLTDEDAESLLTVIEPLARRQGLSDDRSAGQRRAVALVEVMNGALAWMDLPQAGGQRPQVSYVVPAGWACGDTAPSLTELLDAGVLTLPTPVERATGEANAGLVHPQALEEHCATAAWTGPQTRARIETILCDARITRVLRDTIGQVIGLQSLRDDITPAQRRALVARDRHCIATGCTRPPAFCDAHHLTHREDGGETTVDNLVLLCRRHHVLWHRGKLTLSHLHVPWLASPFHAHAPPLAA